LIDELKGKAVGGSGDGSNTGTCTVIINIDSHASSLRYCIYTTIDNNNKKDVVVLELIETGMITLENVVCNSAIIFNNPLTLSCVGANKIEERTTFEYGNGHVLMVMAEDGETANIDYVDVDSNIGAM
jgi:hypothetical protein